MASSALLLPAMDGIMSQKGFIMPKFIDLRGKVFGRLRVIERSKNNKQNKVQWLCECLCGNKIVTSRSGLRGGDTRSCGCYHLDKVSKVEVEEFDLSRHRPYKKRKEKTHDEKLEETKKYFFTKVEKTETCWIWKGKLNKGYGRFQFKNERFGNFYFAHRFSYFIHNGSIDKYKLVCHSCDNPLCVNPEHLWLGTPSDNVMDSKRKGRWDVGLRRKYFKQGAVTK